MATLNEFLNKAMNEGELVGDEPNKADEAVNKAFADQMKKGGTQGGPGKYVAHFNMAMTINKANDMDDAMNKAQKISDEISKKYKLYKADVEVNGIDGPM